jgi:hypothetical protein
MDILKHLEGLYPQYNDIFFESIVYRFSVVGSDFGKEREQLTSKKAKSFSNVYEIYIYATMLGITLNRKSPIESGAKRRIFEEMKDWTQHRELVKFIEMTLLVKADIDLNALENMEEAELKSVASNLKTLLESYANGGFEYLTEQLKANPDYFKDENCFINLLSDVVEG